MQQPDVVIVTGGTGFIGHALLKRLSEHYRVVSLDRHANADSVEFDATSDDSVRTALDRVLAAYGPRIASVIHLAAYFDLSGEPNLIALSLPRGHLSGEHYGNWNRFVI